MNVLLDVDGTLDRHPDFFAHIMGHYPGQRYLITARPETERRITLAHLGEWEFDHYDRLIMWPTPYLFYCDAENKPVFLKDTTGIQQYQDMDHRAVVIRTLLASGLSERYDNDTIWREMAAWKVEKCKELGITVAFEDNATNIQMLRDAGIYVLAVDRNYNGGPDRRI